MSRLTSETLSEPASSEIDAVWTSLRWPGIEHVHLEQGAAPLHADSRAILVLDGAPIRVDYRLAWDAQWCARELFIRTESPGRVNQLELRGDGAGTWTDGEGVHVPELDGCIDVDISMTPLTNTLPIRRMGLAAGERREMLAAFVRVPDLTAAPVAQSYEFLEATPAGSRYLYQSSTFQAELSIDSDDLVVDYATVWKRAPLNPTGG
ncbi:MAG TPA: putative glycolipid-binding domain-containing protein, partial [Acidimicrobiales bacterium]